VTQRHPPKTFDPFVRFWWTDASLTALLGILLLVVFVLLPLRALDMTGTMVIDLFFALIVVSGVVAVATSRLVGALATILAIVTLTLHWWTRLATAPESLEVLDVVASMAMIATLATVVLIQVFREGPITVPRIQGAVCAYVLIGLMFALSYRLVSLLVPDAFNFTAPPPAHDPLTGQLAYFSFVTLTTVGYGDITPVHPAARSLANLEALVGQLFPAILIARLVSLEIHYRQLRRESREEHGG